MASVQETVNYQYNLTIKLFMFGYTKAITMRNCGATNQTIYFFTNQGVGFHTHPPTDCNEFNCQGGSPTPVWRNNALLQHCSIGAFLVPPKHHIECLMVLKDTNRNMLVCRGETKLWWLLLHFVNSPVPKSITEKSTAATPNKLSRIELNVYGGIALEA